MIRLRNGSRIVIKAIRDCSRKRLFSSVFSFIGLLVGSKARSIL